MTIHTNPRPKSSRAPRPRIRHKSDIIKDDAKGPVRPRVRRRPKADAPTSTRSKATKAQACLNLLRRRDGATLEDLQNATGWQEHSVRGFLAGTVKKKLGLTLTSERPSDGPRHYRIVTEQG